MTKDGDLENRRATIVPAIRGWWGGQSAASRLVLGLMLVFLLRGVIYASVIPPWQSPDEPLHFDVVRYLVEERRLPVFGTGFRLSHALAGNLHRTDFFFLKRNLSRFTSRPPEPIKKPARKHQHSLNQQAQHPPLYYLIMIPIYLVFLKGGFILQMYFMRLAAVVMGAAALRLAFVTTREVFPGRTALEVGVPAFIAFHPMFTFIMAMVNNDSLTILLFFALITQLVRGLHTGFTLKRSVWVGITLGLGLMTKATFVPAVPLVMVAYALALIRQPEDWRRTLAGMGLAGGGTAVLAAWWFIRNKSIYGTWLPHPRLVKFVTHEFERLTFPGFIKNTPFLGYMFTRFWADFGWLNLQIARGYYRLLYVATAIALVGLAVIVARRVRAGRVDWRGFKEHVGALYAFSIIAILSGVAYRAWSSMRRSGVMASTQGRYLFPVMVAVAGFMVLGWTGLAGGNRRAERAIVVSMVLGLVALDAICIFRYIIPTYYL